MKISLFKPYLSKKEIKMVSTFLLKSKKLARGEYIKKFEKKFSQYTGHKYAVATSSGTSALHVAIISLGLKKGDEVITTPFSYIASVNCLTYEGIKPCFIDIDLNTLNIDVNKIESAITSKTKAILIVDLLGLPVNSREKLRQIKDKYNILIIEDACESIGKTSDEFPIGRFADVVIYSFHENKQMTTGGEGGMITTNNSDTADLARSICNQGRSNKDDWINNVVLGYNYRMTEMQAVIGIEKLKTLEKIIKKRELIASNYYKFLNKNTFLCPQDIVSLKRSWFYFFIILKDSESREKIESFLKSKGISVATHYFIPIYKFPMYKDLIGDFPNSNLRSNQILALPTYEELSKKQIKFISSCINNFYL